MPFILYAPSMSLHCYFILVNKDLNGENFSIEKCLDWHIGKCAALFILLIYKIDSFPHSFRKQKWDLMLQLISSLVEVHIVIADLGCAVYATVRKMSELGWRRPSILRPQLPCAEQCYQRACDIYDICICVLNYFIRSWCMSPSHIIPCIIIMQELSVVSI